MEVFQRVWLLLFAFISLYLSSYGSCYPNLRPPALFQLNDTFTPSHYKLQIRIPLDDDEISGFRQGNALGSVTIFGLNRSPTSKIVLHAKDLKVNASSATVSSRKSGNNWSDIGIVNVTQEEGLPFPRDFLFIELASGVGAGEELKIHMEYEVSFAEDMYSPKGLFMHSYNTESGETRKLAATSLTEEYGFQHNSRRMFPCFDEPHLMATFEVTVIRQERYSSISNTPRSSTLVDEHHGWMIDKFAVTEKISPNSVSVLVSDFTFTTAVYWDGRIINVRVKDVKERKNILIVHGPEHIVNRGIGNLTVRKAAEVLDFYGTFLVPNGSLEKLDLVFNPDWAGYREKAPGLNYYGSIGWNLKKVEQDGYFLVEKLAKELLPQWTSLTWKDMYLHSGIKKYISNLAVETIVGREHAEDKNNESTISNKILIDLQYNVPLSEEDEDPNSFPSLIEIPKLIQNDVRFPSFLEKKGASLLRMLEEFLPREVIQLGISKYLNKVARDGQQAKDTIFFESLQEAAGNLNETSISRFIKAWVEQRGYPLVTLGKVNNTLETLAQRRIKNVTIGEENQEKWYIPVSIGTLEGSSVEWLTPDCNDPKILAGNPSMITFVNLNGKGYYRTWLDNGVSTNAVLMHLMNGTEGNEYLTRRKLIDDYFALAQNDNVVGPIAIELPFSMTLYLEVETNLIVWETMSRHLRKIETSLSTHPEYYKYKVYLGKKVDAAFGKIGVTNFPKENSKLSKFIGNLLLWICTSLESELCKNITQSIFTEWKLNPNNFPIPYLVDWKRNLLECAIVHECGKDAFDFILELYNAADNNTRPFKGYHKALACYRDANLTLDLVKNSLSENSTKGHLDEEDALDALQILSKVNPHSREAIFELVSSKTCLLSQTTFLWELLVQFTYTTEKQLNESLLFLDINKDSIPGVEDFKADVTRESVSGITWMNTVGDRVLQWLSLKTTNQLLK